MKAALSALGVLVALVAIWQVVSLATGLPAYILPSPAQTLAAGCAQRTILASNALTTLGEMVLGFATGALLGVLCALAMAAAAPLRRLLRPALIASQAIPVFALAPLFVVWMGYGLAPKIAIAALVIFFPVAIAFADGLRRTPPALLEAARVMAGPGARWRVLRHIALPAALPALATGLRLGAGVAAIFLRRENVRGEEIVQRVEHVGDAQFLDVLECCREVAPEVAEHLLPVDLAGRDLV